METALGLDIGPQTTFTGSQCHLGLNTPFVLVLSRTSETRQAGPGRLWCHYYYTPFLKCKQKRVSILKTMLQCKFTPFFHVSSSRAE